MPENNNTTQNDIFGALSDWFSNYQPPDVYGGIDWAQLENNAATARARYTAYQNDLTIRKPYVDAGHQGLTALKDFTSGQVPLDQIPGFRAQMNEELGTLRNFQAARGRLLGGRAAGEMMRTAGRITSDQWQREFSRRYKQAYSGSPFGYSPNYVGAPDAMGLDKFSEKYAGFGGNRARNSAPNPNGGGSQAPDQTLISDGPGDPYLPPPEKDMGTVNNETNAQLFDRMRRERAWRKKHPNRPMKKDWRDF